MSETPEKIWLLNDYLDGMPCKVWCDDPDPSGRGEVEAVEYIRADVVYDIMGELVEDITKRLTKLND